MHAGEQGGLFVVQKVVHLAGSKRKRYCRALSTAYHWIMTYESCLHLLGAVLVVLATGSWPGAFSCQRTMRSNAWTTLEEFNFLSDLIPQFVSQQEIRVVGLWLAEMAAAFFTNFPSRSAQFDRDRLTKVLSFFVLIDTPLTYCV